MYGGPPGRRCGAGPYPPLTEEPPLPDMSEQRKLGTLVRALRLAREEGGQSLVFFAVLLPLLGILGLFAVDLSNGYVNKRYLQNTADAAALAAAYDLLHGQSASAAGADASSYSQKNGWKALTQCTTAVDSPSDTNCWKSPYIDSGGTPHPDEIEVRVRANCSDSITHNFFG